MGVGFRAWCVVACICALFTVSLAETQGGVPEEPVAAAQTDLVQPEQESQAETPDQPVGTQPQGATAFYGTEKPRKAKKGKDFENVMEILGLSALPPWFFGVLGLLWVIWNLINRWGFLSVFCWTRIVDTYWSVLIKYHSFNQWLSEEDGIHMRSGIGSGTGRSKDDSHNTSQNLTPFRDFCGWGRSQPSWMGAGLTGEDEKPDQDREWEATEALAFNRMDINSIHPFKSEQPRSGLTKRTNTKTLTPLDLSAASLFGNQDKGPTQPPSRAPSLTPSFYQSETFPPPPTPTTNPFLKGAMQIGFSHEPFTANRAPSLPPPLPSVTQLRQDMEFKAPAQLSLFAGPPRPVHSRGPTIPVPPRHPFMRSKPQEKGESETWWPRSGPAVAGVNQGGGFPARQTEDLSLQEKLDLDLYDPAFDQMDRD